MYNTRSTHGREERQRGIQTFSRKILDMTNALTFDTVQKPMNAYCGYRESVTLTGW
jgi:hypothetical protein